MNKRKQLNLLGIVIVLFGLFAALGSGRVAYAVDACTGVSVQAGFQCVAQSDGGYTVKKVDGADNASTPASGNGTDGNTNCNFTEYHDLNAGETADAGCPTLYETVKPNGNTGTISLVAEILQKDFKEQQIGDTAYNGWVYPTLQDAQKGACDTAKQRAGLDAFKGWNITINGHDYDPNTCMDIFGKTDATPPTGGNGSGNSSGTTGDTGSTDSGANGGYDPNTVVNDSDLDTSDGNVATYKWIGGDILGDGDCHMAISGPNGDYPKARKGAGVYVKGDFVASDKAGYNRWAKYYQDVEAQTSRTGKCPIVKSMSGK